LAEAHLSVVPFFQPGTRSHLFLFLLPRTPFYSITMALYIGSRAPPPASAARVARLLYLEPCAAHVFPSSALQSPFSFFAKPRASSVAAVLEHATTFLSSPPELCPNRPPHHRRDAGVLTTSTASPNRVGSTAIADQCLKVRRMDKIRMGSIPSVFIKFRRIW
jgi:hypothetical protein